MKNLLLILITSFTLSCCEKDNQSKPIAEIDKLPPATQIGANTVGCLLDGKAFKPGSYNNSTNCFYQYVSGEYFFILGFGNEDAKFNLTALAIGTRKREINKGEIYDLLEYEDGNAYGRYSYNAVTPTATSHNYTGKLTITKLDRVNGIVSGTFWFDVEDQEGVVHRIRDGRFDMHYTN
ncbi:MAG: hypothetical protein ACI7YS_10680 [Flavobacterium sp.]